MSYKGWSPGPRAVVGDPTDPRGMAVLRDQYLEYMAITNYSQDTIFMRRIYINYFIKWCQERSVTRPSDTTIGWKATGHSTGNMRAIFLKSPVSPTTTSRRY